MTIFICACRTGVDRFGARRSDAARDTGPRIGLPGRMEKAVSQPIDPPRRARPWFVATAVLCGIATVLFGFYQWQHRAWEAEVIRHNCRTPLPPLPASEVLGWPLAAVIGAALITLLVGLAAVLIGRHRWWTKVAAAALLAADVLFCLLIVLVVVLLIADPDHGNVQTPESYLCPWLNG